MARTLAIDYGNKRVGLAVTDPLGLIATPLDTIHSKDLVAYVLAYSVIMLNTDAHNTQVGWRDGCGLGSMAILVVGHEC